MKKLQLHLFSVLLLIGSPFFLCGQTNSEGKETVVRTTTMTSTFSLLENEGINIKVPPSIKDKKFVDLLWQQSSDIQLKDQTDLSVSYQLEQLEKGLSYTLDFSLFDEKNQLLKSVPYKLYGDLGTISNNKEKAYFNFVYQDILESGVYYGPTYTLNITCSLIGEGLNCNEEQPKFDWGKRWYFYLPAAAGISAAIIGGINKNNYQPPYNNYLQLWEAGTSLGEAQPAFDLARKKQTRNTNLVNYGIGVATLSALLAYFYWKKKHKSKIDNYKRYCKKITATNTSKANGLRLLPASEGIGLAVQF